MPELPIFAKSIAIGFIASEIFHITYLLGENFSKQINDNHLIIRTAIISASIFICSVYIYLRQAHIKAKQILFSYRIDLFIAILLGIWTNLLTSPLLYSTYNHIKYSNYFWAPILLVALLLVLASSILQTYRSRENPLNPQLQFLTDEEIKADRDDILDNKTQARSFAETVLASRAHTGLVFGLEGPWGVGKTSFINLAEQYWEKAGHNSIIVFRFEPLRYASDPDLSERFINELSSTLQGKVFAPEFRPAASRYSKMLKGAMDFSFLGFKFTLTPSDESIDELLDNIDGVLKRIRRRIIIIVDDLDRLEPKTVNNILFTIQRTFKLSQAVYILCYDTENLIGKQSEGDKAREFLEKFVTIQLSLFVDMSNLISFLKTDWKESEGNFQSIPSDAMFKLSSILSVLAEMLDSELAPQYIPIIGNLRKLKRFINTIILIQIDKINFEKTDFHHGDIINLMLIHLNYPGLFRLIYTEEANGNSGIFSAKRRHKDGHAIFTNHNNLEEIVKKQEPSAQFLLNQLFHIKNLGIENSSELDESIYSSRACFNQQPYRNLEKYLQLIVKFIIPAPHTSFKIYQDAVDRVANGTPIPSILTEFSHPLESLELSHDQFWRVLISQAHQLNQNVIDNAISVLVDNLPRYSSVGTDAHGFRQKSIYSLIRLVNQSYKASNTKRSQTHINESPIQIAYRILGEGPYKNNGLLCKIADPTRGIIGWNDIMLFRLQCSPDRRGQVDNIHAALSLHEKKNTPKSEQSEPARGEMRALSQSVFSIFQKTFIKQKRNFLRELDETPSHMLLGGLAQEKAMLDKLTPEEAKTLETQQHATRSMMKTFITYQLTNTEPPTGSGIGCGVYDERGNNDSGGISAAMNKYIFDFCFNPLIQEENVLIFSDYCLSNLSNTFWIDQNEEGYIPTESGLASGLDPMRLKKYWIKFRDKIIEVTSKEPRREVITMHYIATYEEDLPKVFSVLDNMTPL